MKRTFYLLAIALLLSQQAIAQTKQYNSAEILHQLQKLNTVGSVLYVAAHPDDENTRLLAYLANEKHLRTGYLSITRGDGGQNLIGKEQSELLGLIRTQELLTARRTDGAEQFFTRANDFGYSKSPEETLNFWNKDSVLADVVWVIRNFKPDVIICRFPTDGRGGHGHHTASAMLAEEAFDAAADPNRFPEQLKYTEVWQARRLFWNSYNFGSNNTTTEEQIKMNVGIYNPLLGASYGEIAAQSRSMHKSQGFGVLKQRGEIIEYFQQIKGDSVAANSGIFAGLNSTWGRLSGTKKIEELINKVIKEYDPLNPSSSTGKLTGIYKEIQKLDEKDPLTRYWKKQKLQQCEELIIASAGLWMEATADDYIAIPGDSISVSAEFINNGNEFIDVQHINFLGIVDSSVSKQVYRKKMDFYTPVLYTVKTTQKLPLNTKYSNPYWLNDEHSTGMYTVKDQLLRGKPENAPAAVVTYYLNVGGLELAVERPVVYKYRDPIRGEVYRPLEILPPATVNVAEEVYIFSDTTPQKVKFIIHANKDNLKGSIEAVLPSYWKINFKNPFFNLAKKGDEVTIEAVVNPTGNASEGTTLFPLLRLSGMATYNRSIKRIDYEHIPQQFWLSDAEAKLVNIPITKTNTTIGYIPGAGDGVAACLRQVGYNVVELTDDMLANDDLSKYSAIIAGIRAYNTNANMRQYYSRLMEYIKNGGNYIVQYNTNSRVGPFAGKIAPYDFTISRDRVTDETATVAMDNHPALNYPNKITQNDFEGWIQERGIYFATELDSNFKAPLTMNDPNEKPHNGSLVIAPYGKGNFVYTGLAFFRELPAGVPGAYRLMVNLISLPKNN